MPLLLNIIVNYVTEADISTSHRLGRPQPHKKRPIVAKFVRRDVRTDLLRNKKKLNASESHKDVMIGEHLSPGRAKLLQAVKQDDHTEKVWTIDGKIHCTQRNHPGKKFTINSQDDLFKNLGWDEEKLRKSGLFVNISP